MPTPLSRYSPQDAINQQTKSLKVDEAAIQNMIQQLGGGQFSGGPAIQINGGYQQPSVQRDMASLEAAMLMSNAANNPDRYGGRVANRAMQGKALRLENDAQMGQQMEADAMAQAQQMQAMQQQQLAEQEEIEVRKQYVAGLDPIVAERFPNLSSDERKQFLLSTYSQKLSPEKLFADKPGKPTEQKVTNADGSTTTRYIDSQTGQAVEGGGWQPFSSGNAPKKENRFVKVTLPDGSEVEREFNSDRTVVNEIQTKAPLPEGGNLKAFADMSHESRKALSLTSTAARSFAVAIDQIAPDGKFASNLARYKAGSDERAAYLNMMSSTLDNLRMTTGAAIQDSEVQRDIDRFIPNATDSDKIAMSKLRNLYRTISTSYDAITEGYEQAQSKSLQWPDMPMWLKGNSEESIDDIIARNQ